MHEIIAFLLGASLVLFGVYVWWAQRRFRLLREAFLELLKRAEHLDEGYLRLNRRTANQEASLISHARSIEFLLADRVVPPDPNPSPDRELTGEKADKETVWDRLRSNVESL